MQITQRLYFLILFSLLSTTFYGQKIKQSKSFLQKLEQTQLDIFTPVEGKYKSVRPTKNPYQNADHIVLSKKEDLEIRYAIIPFSESDQQTQMPRVDFMRVVSSTATNDDREDAVVSIHQVEETDLKENYNADWGNIAYFQPKSRFSDRKHCRLLTLYSEGRGIVHVFFLFDEPSQFLDNRLHALRFETKI